MRIVFIITGLGTGGAETMLFKVLERLDRGRFAPNVISLTTSGEIGPRIAALGIPVEAMGITPGLPNPIHLYRLIEKIRRERPDAVSTWMYHADLLGGLAARLAGVSAVGWGIRNGNLDRDKTKRMTRVVARLCAVLSHSVPRRILACSEAARSTHVSLGYVAEKMLVVPNGFDLFRFKPDRETRSRVRVELDIADTALIVGLIGRFDSQKNHAGFFEAAGLLHRHRPQVHFLLAGQGIDQNNETLMSSIIRAGVLANTHLLGLRDDMPRLMTALDVLVSSSHSEAFPNVLGEAMACAIPCVVTDVGDSAYIVGDTGYAVSAGNMTGLAEAMEALLALPAAEREALGERARARVAAHFEISAVVRQYEDFFESLSMHAQ